jgi:hypothetical protein
MIVAKHVEFGSEINKKLAFKIYVYQFPMGRITNMMTVQNSLCFIQCILLGLNAYELKLCTESLHYAV